MFVEHLQDTCVLVSEGAPDQARRPESDRLRKGSAQEKAAQKI